MALISQAHIPAGLDTDCLNQNLYEHYVNEIVNINRKI